MTKLDNVAQFAKDSCREAMHEARRLQQELGVPEGELCSLPATFNRFRSVERLNALTAEFETIADECRKTFAASPAGQLAALAMANEVAAARKVCERELANLQRLQRQAGQPVSASRSFKKLPLKEIERLGNEYRALADTLLAKAKAEREACEAEAAAEVARMQREADEQKRREARELERKRQREHNAKLQQQYNQLKQPGRTLQPFGVWARERGYQAVG
jgi:hypothetical protein